jgi:hypothetical protein
MGLLVLMIEIADDLEWAHSHKWEKVLILMSWPIFAHETFKVAHVLESAQCH